jgi:hypothetical protein
VGRGLRDGAFISKENFCDKPVLITGLPRHFLRRSWVSVVLTHLVIIQKRDLEAVEFLNDTSYARDSEGTDVLVVPRK